MGGADGIIRRCVPEYEQKDVLRKCHDSPCEGHLPMTEPRIRYFNQVFTGLLSLRMLEILFYLVINVKGLVVLVEGMKCL